MVELFVEPGDLVDARCEFGGSQRRSSGGSRRGHTRRCRGVLMKGIPTRLADLGGGLD